MTGAHGRGFEGILGFKAVIVEYGKLRWKWR